MQNPNQEIIRKIEEIERICAEIKQSFLSAEKKSNPGTVEKKIGKQKRIKLHPSSHIDELIKESYFKNPGITSSLCRKRLQEKGFAIPIDQITTALLMKVRKGKLQRKQSKEGFVYFQ